MNPPRFPVRAVPLLLCLFTTGIAVAKDDTQSPVVSSEFIFEKAPFPSCHASTIVESAAGSLIAAWFGGTKEQDPDVGIWLSRHESGGWSSPVEVANGIQYVNGDGTVVRHPTWNPVLFQPKSGPLLLFYKCGPTPQGWWGMLMTSPDDGHTWSEPRRLPEGILGPIKDKPVELANGTLFCPSSSERVESGWTVHFEFTRDLGRTWKRVGPINTKEEFNAIQPTVLFHKDGRLQVLCRSQENFITTSWSSDQGNTWTPMKATSLPNPNSGIDAVTLVDGRQLLVYNHTSAALVGENQRWPLNVAVSPDGIEWKQVATLEDQPTPNGYAYPAVIQTRDGLVHVTYTWKRERIKHIVMDPARF